MRNIFLILVLGLGLRVVAYENTSTVRHLLLGGANDLHRYPADDSGADKAAKRELGLIKQPLYTCANGNLELVFDVATGLTKAKLLEDGQLIDVRSGNLNCSDDEGSKRTLNCSTFGESGYTVKLFTNKQGLVKHGSVFTKTSAGVKFLEKLDCNI